MKKTPRPDPPVNDTNDPDLKPHYDEFSTFKAWQAHHAMIARLSRQAKIKRIKELFRKWWYPSSVIITLSYCMFYYAYIWKPGGLVDKIPDTFLGYCYITLGFYSGIGILIACCLLIGPIERLSDDEWIGNSVHKKKDAR